MSANDYIQSIKDNPKNRKVLVAVEEGKRLELKWSEFEHQIRLAYNAGLTAGKYSKSLLEQILG